MAALLTRMGEVRRGLLARGSNPFTNEVARLIPFGCDEITTNALCDMLGKRPGAQTYRKLARAMSELGWIPFKSRRFSGHWRGQEARGWTRTRLVESKRGISRKCD
jgi:hypothetical protein